MEYFMAIRAADLGQELEILTNLIKKKERERERLHALSMQRGFIQTFYKIKFYFFF